MNRCLFGYDSVDIFSILANIFFYRRMRYVRRHGGFRCDIVTRSFRSWFTFPCKACLQISTLIISDYWRLWNDANTRNNMERCSSRKTMLTWQSLESAVNKCCNSRRLQMRHVGRSMQAAHNPSCCKDIEQLRHLYGKSATNANVYGMYSED